MYQLFETIRVEDGKAHFVHYHQQRVDRSVGCGCVNLDSYIQSIELPDFGCHKLRITYWRDGILLHTVTPYTARTLTSFRLVEALAIDYACKWENRSAIELLYERRDGCDDVIIVREGLVTDCSFANIALLGGDGWVTPSEPLLAGTCRARLIEQGVLTPKRVSVDSLLDYEKMLIINAMVGFDATAAVAITAVRR